MACRGVSYHSIRIHASYSVTKHHLHHLTYEIDGGMDQFSPMHNLIIAVRSSRDYNNVTQLTLAV